MPGHFESQCFFFNETEKYFVKNQPISDDRFRTSENCSNTVSNLFRRNFIIYSPNFNRKERKDYAKNAKRYF